MSLRRWFATFWVRPPFVPGEDLWEYVPRPRVAIRMRGMSVASVAGEHDHSDRLAPWRALGLATPAGSPAT